MMWAIEADARRWPQAASVFQACQVATADENGDVVLTSRQAAVTARGVRVSLASLGAREAAVAYLRALGYVVERDGHDGPPVNGDSVLVSGWNTQVLQYRASWLEDAAMRLEDEHCAIAGMAVGFYRYDVERCRTGERRAEAAVVERLRLHATASGSRLGWTTRAMDQVAVRVAVPDLERASEGVRPLLVRVAVAQESVSRLVDSFEVTGRDVIEAFRLIRGRGELSLDRAENVALAGVRDEVRAIRMRARRAVEERIGDSGATEPESGGGVTPGEEGR